MTGIGTTPVGFCGRGERLGSTLYKTRKSRHFCSQGAGEESVDGKLLRGTIRSKGDSGEICLIDSC